jgi:hypothetical protein
MVRKKITFRYGSEEDKSSSFRLCDFKPSLLVDGDKIVARGDKIEILIDYPLKNSHIFICYEKPFTLKRVIEQIIGIYRDIYESEEKHSASENIPGMYNRKPTDGPFGITWHHFHDLFLEGLSIDEENVIHLNIGS